jgi:hypothetical protein
MVSFGVGDLLEGPGFIDAQVVHENVHLGETSCGLRCGVSLGQVERERFDSSRGNGRANGCDGFGHARLGAAADDDARSFGGEGFGDCESDAGGRAGDEGEFVFELKVHSSLSVIWCDLSFGGFHSLSQPARSETEDLLSLFIRCAVELCAVNIPHPRRWVAVTVAKPYGCQTEGICVEQSARFAGRV